MKTLIRANLRITPKKMHWTIFLGIMNTETSYVASNQHSEKLPTG